MVVVPYSPEIITLGKIMSVWVTIISHKIGSNINISYI